MFELRVTVVANHVMPTLDQVLVQTRVDVTARANNANFLPIGAVSMDCRDYPAEDGD